MLSDAPNIRNFVSMANWSDQDLLELLDTADALKSRNFRSREGEGKVLGLLFFNPSLRTKVSFEVASAHFGATTSIISPGQGSWTLETEIGAIMNGNKTEHVKEAVQVLSRYCDAIGVRAFSTLKDKNADMSEAVIRDITQYADVPIINLESAMEHPCQSMADWMTIRELFGKNQLADKKLVLTWAPHPFPLPQAVPNSVLEMASRSGIQLTLACPPEMVPEDPFLSRYKEQCRQKGHEMVIEHDQQKALQGADVVYAKSWAAPVIYDEPLREAQLRKEIYKDWTLSGAKMKATNDAYFMHCLPVRRNVVVTDDVIDGPRARHIDEAENRLHAQKAILMKLWNLSL